MPEYILVLNAGSSSLKLGVFEAGRPDVMLAQGLVSRVGTSSAALQLNADSREVKRDWLPCPDHTTALRLALGALVEIDPAFSGTGGEIRAVRAVGHRVVHGGSTYTEPTVITPEVAATLDSLCELAPLHNGRAIEVVQSALALMPDIPQIACFDTMFHAHLPEETARYALPREISDRYGIRRYGFHGLSCEWSMSRLRIVEGHVPSRAIICHLGAGASVTAVRDGRSVDTSMGFTPLEGLIMATRSGSIDPSIVLYLQRHAGMSPEEVEDLLERQSGLLALSGKTGDVQSLEEMARDGDQFAEEALSAFAYRVRMYIGAFWAVLGGLDVVVMTGGIGEHSPEMRARMLEPLRPLGIEIDWAANGAAHGSAERCLSPHGMNPAVWVIPAREEQVIAEQVARILTPRQKIR